MTQKDKAQHKNSVVLSLSGSGSYLLQHMGTLACLQDTGLVDLETEVVAYQGLSGGSMVAAMANAGLLSGFKNNVRKRIENSSFSCRYKAHLIHGFERTKDSSFDRACFLADELGEWNKDSELSWNLSENFFSQAWSVWRHGGRFNLEGTWERLWELMPKTYCSPEDDEDADTWNAPMLVYAWKIYGESPALFPTTKSMIDESSPYKYHVIMDPDMPTWLPIVSSCSVPLACRLVRHKFKGEHYVFHKTPPNDHEDKLADGALLDNNPDQNLLGVRGFDHLVSEKDCGCVFAVESVDVISDKSTQGYYMGNYTSTPADSWWRWMFFVNLYQIVKGSLLGLLRSKRIEHIADTMAKQINEKDNQFFMILNNKVDVSKRFPGQFKETSIPDSTQFTGWTKDQAMAAITQGYESAKDSLEEQKTKENILKYTGRSAEFLKNNK
jgi:hypothetical protein